MEDPQEQSDGAARYLGFHSTITESVGLGGWAGKARETPLSHSYCQHVVTSGAPLLVENAQDHPLVCTNLATSELGVRAYLGVPIRSPDGFILGSLCAIDTKARMRTPRGLELMKEFSALLETKISLRVILLEKSNGFSRKRALLNSATFSVIAMRPDGIIEFFSAGAGFGATRKIRSGQIPGVDQRIPIIALTASAFEDDRAKCLSAGMDGFVTKPIRFHDLERALCSCNLI